MDENDRETALQMLRSCSLAQPWEREAMVSRLHKYAAFLAHWTLWQREANQSRQHVVLALFVYSNLVTPLRQLLVRLGKNPPLSLVLSEAGAVLTVLPFGFKLVIESWPTIPERISKAAVYNCVYKLVTITYSSSESRRFLQSCWEEALVVLSGQVSSFLAFGRLDDPHHEFFIQANDKFKDDSEAERTHAFVSFSVAPDRLPLFVSKLSAQNIAMAGHVTLCTQRILERQLPNSGIKSPRGFLRENDNQGLSLDMERISNVFVRMAESAAQANGLLEAASGEWRVLASTRLSEVLPIQELLHGLSSIRLFLLIGGDLFWHMFFARLSGTTILDRTDPELPEKREAAERSLNKILVSVYGELGSDLFEADSHYRFEDTGIPLTLKLTNDGGVIPHYVLTVRQEVAVGSWSCYIL